VYRVILIDDEAWTLAGLEKSFRWADRGFQVMQRFSSARTALDYLEKEAVDVVFTDIRMPGMTGLELLQRLREKANEAEVVIISGFSEFEYAKQAMHWRALDFLVKPVSLEEADILLRRLEIRLDEKAHQAPDAMASGRTEMEVRVDNQAFSELLDYMQNHFSEPLQLRDLAVQSHISLSYCCLLFQRNLKKTFSEHLTDLRMKSAAALLREGSANLSEVCVQVGINDYYYFIRVFRKYFGITPSRYRKGQA